MLTVEDVENFRKNRRLSKIKFCNYMEISQDYYYKILKGERKIPKEWNMIFTMLYYNLPKWSELVTILPDYEESLKQPLLKTKRKRKEKDIS
jgi:transcriptional regulator with XRE-family HTH domain